MCVRVAQVKPQTSGSGFGVGAIEEDDVIPLKNIMKKRRNVARKCLGQNPTIAIVTTPSVTMLPPLPLSQDTTSELCQEEIPTQQLQTMAKRVGPSMWNQLQHKKKSQY